MAFCDNHTYYIITAQPMDYSWIKAGTICYHAYYTTHKPQDHTVYVRCIGNGGSGLLSADILQPLTRRKSEFLLALESSEERLTEMVKPEILEQAMELNVGSEVKVEQNGEWLKGVVKYIGPLLDSLDPIVGVFFGVELQGEDRGKGQTDGSYGHKSCFKCQKDCGVFVPFTRIKAQHPKPSAPWLDMPENPPVSVGDRITYFLDEKSECQYGMVLNLQSNGMILISTDTDEHGKLGGEREIPWQCVIKEEDLQTDEWHKSNSEKVDISEGSHADKDPNLDATIKVGSRVKVNLNKGPAFATVRWLGSIPDKPNKIAGLELDEADGVSDGTFLDNRYFTCLPKHGLFVRLSICQSVEHFLGETAANGYFDHNEQDISAVPPLRSEDVMAVLNGRMKGIQGHCNSCYMDAALFRKSCNQTNSVTEMEQTSYLYQIFMDYNHGLVLPTVQQLLEHSFYNNDIKLAEVPSCLILTMPRSGKQFKMFPKIIPSLQLDITALLSNGLQQCVLCGQLGHVECSQCFIDPTFSNTGLKIFCGMCSDQVHFHPSRQSHKPTLLQLPEGFSYSRSTGGLAQTPPREKLELFAVLCIETSHYVSFVKHGPKITDWIFFDSMADRIGETDGFNIPEVKACPEVARYLTMPLAELAKQVPREMDGVAKRLICDGYMYLYQSPSMALYH
ncbi:Ubiquitin carboxyl-terminal hydrolase CYLD [Bagarius yarrelli]|uniref:ubiquitinyl hydrolase 1 n=1 Tax=Bagarius yarrelli TaxID=175774 RepID=A0A556TY30_BAGYA|nr:Ubiquitin carboxyl-terminal hydrolase CYLD [Bagarius yarrelli]